MTKILASGPYDKTGRVRMLTAALLLAVMAGASGCANRDSFSTGSVPDDYRTRHPIVVGEAEKTIDIPVVRSQTRLTRGQEEVIAGFVSDFSRASTGSIQIMAPSGGANAYAAQGLSRDVRRLMTRMGIASKRILSTTYADDASVLRLSYVAITAQTAPCGQWPEDMTLNTSKNVNYYNFGCASQSNLAAQIANPNDLLGPRRMTPPDAVQRGQAIERYRAATVELEDM